MTKASEQPTDRRRVSAILVVSAGADRLSDVLTAAAAVGPRVELVAVDNASGEAASALLRRRLPEGRVLRLERNAGFGTAVAAALEHEAAAGAEYVLLLHDDLALAPDALSHLVDALSADPGLAIVGPKLRQWDDAALLQDVGMTIDGLGRADSPLEASDLDQGQHDRRRDVLYVSTAGMLVRADVLRRLGGFDQRYPAMRDDLDLCWRCWITGQRVGVVPSAVGYHGAATSALRRPVCAGQPWQARQLAERHTVATLLKNTQGRRLLWVVPALVVLLPAKAMAFLLTGRPGDAAAVVSAIAWNLRQLPGTLERRRRVQALRRVPDARIAGLFSPGSARLRAYGEELGGRLRRARAAPATEAASDHDGPRRRFRALREHPAAWAAGGLLAVYLVGLLPLLGPGPIVGGQIAPWPEAARDFLRTYLAAWAAQPLGSGGLASPLQALLGILSLAGLGSSWLAQRLVVFGLLPLAWLLTLRSARLLGAPPAARILGATAYTLSPVVLGALAEGRFGALVVAALLPGVLSVGLRTAGLVTAGAPGTRSPQAAAWRAVPPLTLGLLVMGAADPGFGLLLGVVLLAAVGLAAAGGPAERHAALRLAAAAVAAGVLLGPWLLEVLRFPEGPQAALAAFPVGAPGDAAIPLWRAVTGTPALLPGLDRGAGVVLALMALVLVIAVLRAGWQQRNATVVGLTCVVVAGGLAAWWLSAAQWGWLWPPLLLLPGALALAACAVIAAPAALAGLRSPPDHLARGFAGLLGVLLFVGLGSSAVRLATCPWRGLMLDPQLVPAFVAADAPRVGPYRVLLLSGGEDVVRWDVSEADGPSMLTYGTVPSVALRDFLDDTVARTVGGREPGAGALLGLANVRYVVVAESAQSDEVLAALSRQDALEPLPAVAGRVLRVRTWLPRAVALPAGDLAEVLQGRVPEGIEAVEDQGLRAVGPGVYAGVAGGAARTAEPPPEPRTLLVAEAADPSWTASWDDRGSVRLLQRQSLGPVNAFRLPEGRGRVRVAADPTRHHLLVAAQVFILVGLASMRFGPPLPAAAAGAPPGRRGSIPRDPGGSIPRDPGGSIPRDPGGSTPRDPAGGSTPPDLDGAAGRPGHRRPWLSADGGDARGHGHQPAPGQTGSARRGEPRL